MGHQDLPSSYKGDSVGSEVTTYHEDTAHSSPHCAPPGGVGLGRGAKTRPWGSRWGARGPPGRRATWSLSSHPGRWKELNKKLKDVANPGKGAGVLLTGRHPQPHAARTGLELPLQHHLRHTPWGHGTSCTPRPHASRPQYSEAYWNRRGVKKLRLWLLWAVAEVGLLL